MQPVSVRIFRAAELLVGILFAFAAIMKIAEPEGFLFTCRYLFSGIAGTAAATGVAVVVVGAEAAIGIRFLLGGVSLRWIVFAIILVGALSVALTVLVLDPLSPPCACLGITRWVQRANKESSIGLVRNVALLWILALLASNRVRNDRVESPRAVDLLTEDSR